MNMLILPKYERSFHIFPPGQHNNWSTFVCCLWRHGMVSNVESAQIFYVWSYQWQGCQLISRQIHLNAPELLDLWLCFFVGLVCWDGKFYCFLGRNLSSLLEITITHLQFLICFTHLSSKSPRLPMRCAFFLSLTREKKASIRNDIQNPYGIPWSTDCFVRIFVIAYNPYIITG